RHIDAIVEAVDRALKDPAIVALQRELNRDAALILATGRRAANALDIGLLIDLEIGVDGLVGDDRGQKGRAGARLDKIAERDLGTARAPGDRDRKSTRLNS